MQGSFNKCKSVNDINHINDLNYSNCLIISKDVQHALDKIQDHFKLKTLERLRIEETSINIIKTAYNKPEANIIINGKNSKHSHQSQKTKKIYSPDYDSVLYLKSLTTQEDKKKSNKRDANMKRGNQELLFKK